MGHVRGSGKGSGGRHKLHEIPSLPAPLVCVNGGPDPQWHSRHYHPMWRGGGKEGGGANNYPVVVFGLL